LNLGVGYEAGDRGLILNSRFANQSEVPTFLTASNHTGRTRVIVELGAELGISEHEYRGSFRNNDRFYSATIGMRATW
jgi:hypothetical protein